ncbi:MAG: PaaI family thioesterase [Anaerolineae bacterium]
MPEAGPKIGQAPHVGFLEAWGVVIESYDDDQATLSMPIQESMLNPNGTLHGAVAYALADTGMGLAAYRTVQAGQGTATVEMKINYVRPATEGRISAACRVLHRGRTLILTSAEVRNEAGHLIASATATYFIIDVAGSG